MEIDLFSCGFDDVIKRRSNVSKVETAKEA